MSCFYLHSVCVTLLCSLTANPHQALLSSKVTGGIPLLPQIFSFLVQHWHTSPTTARPSLSPPPSLASPLNYYSRKKRKASVALWWPYTPYRPRSPSLHTCISLILQGPVLPKRTLEGNVTNVAEYGQTRKHCDMLLLFSYAPFSYPFPTYFPPSYSFCF